MIFLRVLKFMRIQSECLNNAMDEFDVIFVTGYWGHIPARQALATVDTELHGQNIQWYFHMWDVAQVDSVRLSQILHWCLVLARFCHCRCEYAQKSKIFDTLRAIGRAPFFLLFYVYIKPQPKKPWNASHHGPHTPLTEEHYYKNPI